MKNQSIQPVKTNKRELRRKKREKYFDDINTNVETQFEQKDRSEVIQNVPKVSKSTDSLNEIEDEETEEKIENQTEHDKISQLVQQLMLKNKINLKNVFDIPLPNVSQMSAFSKNVEQFAWKQLSATLESGAKMFGLRVDFIHNEVYKIISGLIRGISENQQIDMEQNENINNITNLSDAQEIIENQIKKQEQGRKKQQKNGEENLEKNLHNITLDRYDLQFDIDPLFEKTSQKFDDSGAKGLLLNNLQIDAQIIMKLDSCNIFQENQQKLLKQNAHKKQSQKNDKKIFEKKLLIVIVLNQILELCPPEEIFLKVSMCPEFSKFRNELLTRSKEIFDLSVNFYEKNDEDMQFPLEEQVLYDDNNYLEDMESRMQNYDTMIPIELPFNPTELPLTIDSNLNFGTQTDENTQNQFENTLSESTVLRGPQGFNFSFLNEQLSKIGQGQTLKSWNQNTWMGPEQWNIMLAKQSKLKKRKLEGKDTKQSKNGEHKKDKALEIDFNLKKKEKITDIFESKTSKIKLSPQASLNCTQLFLQMRDFQIAPQRHLYPFLRRNIKQLTSSQAETKQLHGSLEAPFENEKQYSINGDNFIDVDNLGQEEDQLEQIGGEDSFIRNVFLENKGGKNNYQIRELKEEMWNQLEHNLPQFEPQNQSQKENLPEQIANQRKSSLKPQNQLTFSSVLQTMKKVQENKNKMVSIQACFITLLHLANENSLYFESQDDDPDFLIWKY